MQLAYFREDFGFWSFSVLSSRNRKKGCSSPKKGILFVENSDHKATSNHWFLAEMTHERELVAQKCFVYGKSEP